MRSDNENLLDILRHIKQHYQYQFYLLASTLQLLSKVITDAQCISRNCNNVQAVNVIKPTIFFSIWVFFHEHSRFTGQQGKGEGICLAPLYHFHPLHRHLDISRAITPESSPLHIAGSRTRTGNLWFPSASH